MTEHVPQSGRERGIIYIVALVVLIVLAVIALFTFREARQTADAQDKATQLTHALEATGMRAPTTDQIVRVLGNDGGAVCADPNAALSRTLVLGSLMNGAGGPGMRPVIVEHRVLRSQLLIMGVYCPDQLPNQQKFFDGLSTVGS